jgi:membrane-associated phospholipid phosphatase
MATPTGSPYLGDAGDFLLVNRFAGRTGWLHGVMTGYAVQGVGLFFLLLLAGWWLARRSGNPRTVAAAAWAGLGTLVAVGVNQPIVNGIAEARPYASIPHVLVLVGRSTDPAFPSDHATMAGAVAAGVCYVDRRLGVTAWVAAVLLAFARVYVGAHYPHDVAAGLALGAAVIVVGHTVARPPLTWVTTRLAGTPLRPLLTVGPAAVPGGMPGVSETRVVTSSRRDAAG